VRPSPAFPYPSFHCVYRVDKDRFLLERLTVATDRPASINGVAATKLEVPDLYRYDSLPLPIHTTETIQGMGVADTSFYALWNFSQR